MKIQGKIFKVGNSYGIRLSKHWVESGIVKEGEEINVELPIEKTKNKNGTSGIKSWDSYINGNFPISIS